VIDFHCHLDLYPDPQQIAAGCRERGVYVLSVTTTPSAWGGTTVLANGADRITTALGLHPQLAYGRKAELALFDQLLPQTRYVGEIGLDGGREFRQQWTAQLTVFDHVLESCARAGGRILSVHSRRASRALLDRLEAHQESGVPVLHWFTGSHRDLDRAITLGCWFSVGPAMLRGDRGRGLAARMPQDRILTESDGPFARMDGAPVLPWQVDKAVRILSGLWGVSPAEAEQITHCNLRTLTTFVPSALQ
jgi:TatD DNase family protein